LDLYLNGEDYYPLVSLLEKYIEFGKQGFQFKISIFLF